MGKAEGGHRSEIKIGSTRQKMVALRNQLRNDAQIQTNEYWVR